MYPNYEVLTGLRKQRGFLIPLSLFIVVAMGALALVVSRTATQTNKSFTQELLGVQAFYAAESGAQRGMQALFFPDASNRTAVDGRCQSLNQNYNFSGITGLQICNAQVSCTCNSCVPGDPASYYTITSIGSCGSGFLRAERTISVGSYMDQQP